MTLSPLLIYLWGVADNLKQLTFAFSFLGVMVVIIGLFIMFLSMIHDDEEIIMKFKPFLVKFGICVLLSSLFHCLIPSSKTIAVMVVAPAIVNSSVVQKDIPELYKVGVEALKESFKNNEAEKEIER